jgi:uncharacterized YigZ family protein
MRHVIEALRYEGDPIKGSRFIVDVAPVTTDAAAHAFVERVAREFPDASHHCSAWRLVAPAIERANDDGEPSGSAGRPILSQLAGRDLVDTAVVVTRYFGGTKLGVGGLVRAYGGETAAALDLAVLRPWVELVDIRLEVPYAANDAVERVIDRIGGACISRDFATSVTLVVRLPAESLERFSQSIADITAGEAVIDGA